MAFASSTNIDEYTLRTRQDSEEISGLIDESEEQREKIMQLRDEIYESEKSQSKMEDRLESKPRGIEYYGEEKELLNALRARTEFLESEVIRLQRELGSASAEAEIAETEAKIVHEELWRRKIAFEQSNRDEDRSLEKEKVALMEQVERLKMENQIQIFHLQKEALNEIFEREKEILTLERELEESRAKNMEMEKKILELEWMTEGREFGVWRGMKFPWPAAASAGTVVAAAMIFMSWAKQRRQ